MKDHDCGPSRRSVLQSIGAVTAAGTLAGCLGSDDDENRFWTTQTQEDRQQVINGLIDRFEDEHDKELSLITVEEDDVPTEISSAQAADRLPAAAELPIEPMQTLGTEGALSMENTADVIDAIGEDGFYDGALDMVRSPEGEYYAVPFHGWVQGFWYRQSKFEEHGLDAPTDWESLLEAAETLHDPDNDEYGIVIGSEEASYTTECFTPFARSNDARVFNADSEIVFDSDEMVETLEYYAELDEYTPPGYNNWEAANNTFLNEQSFLIEYSSFIMGDIFDSDIIDADDVAFAPFVEHERQSTFGTLSVFNLLDIEDEEGRETATEFAEFLLTDEEYIEFLHMAPGGMNPVLEQTAQSDEYADNETLAEWDDETLANISGAFDTIERFGYVDGQLIPEYSEITSRFLVAESIQRVIDGDDANTVVEEQAEAMRDAIN